MFVGISECFLFQKEMSPQTPLNLTLSYSSEYRYLVVSMLKLTEALLKMLVISLHLLWTLDFSSWGKSSSPLTSLKERETTELEILLTPEMSSKANYSAFNESTFMFPGNQTHNLPTNRAIHHIVTVTIMQWFEKLISPPFFLGVLLLGEKDGPIFVDFDTAHNGRSFT